jgi:hypothetical protein
MYRFLLSLVFASVAHVGLAAAQDNAPPTEDVIVRGQSQDEAIRSFIDQLAVSARGVDQLSTWDFRICPGVAGLRAQHAQLVVDRMAQRAMDVGLSVGEPGCRANVLVMISMDPDTLAQQLFNESPAALGFYSERGQSTLGRAALRDFVESDAPVRWWHVSQEYTQGNEAVTETLDGQAPYTVRHGGPSLLRRGTHLNFVAAIVIVDGRRLVDGVDLGALADYLAMVTLAQVDPEAETQGLPTILNLFVQAGAPHTLTEWDVGYLRGLYATGEDDNRNRQQTIMRSTMEDAVQQ